MTQAEDLRERTKRFAIRIVYLFRALPKSGEAQIMGRQLLRSGTSVAANYRAVCKARSKAEFIARIGVVAEEADESVFVARDYGGDEGAESKTASKYCPTSSRTCSDFLSVPQNIEERGLNYPITNLPNYPI